MIPAWYMTFRRGHSGGLDRIGGIPTHLPPDFPRSPDPDSSLVFLAQFECHPERLALPDTFLLQVYLHVTGGMETPVVIRVGHDAEENVDGVGVPYPDVVPHDVEWTYREDPDESMESDRSLAEAKVWGCCYYFDALEPGERLLLNLTEEPGRFDFGGDELMFAINESNDIIWFGV